MFAGVWKRFIPYIQFMTTRTDLCGKCEKHRLRVGDSRTEEEKQHAVEDFQGHLETARLKRDVYRESCASAREELDKYMISHPTSLTTPPLPSSADLHEMHYTFDFCQPVTLPHHTQQSGPLYFLQGRKVQIFGIADDGSRQQVNFMLDEEDTIGIDGTSSHGPNTTVSLLHFYLSNFAHGEKGASFHADNCPGQNKNKTFLHYFLWRCCVGLNDDITFLFMEPGHTKCFCDSCFGMIKRVFRKSDVNTIQELERVVERSSKGNRPCHFSSPEEGHVFRDWATFLGDSLLPLKGISRFFKFRFTKTDPGDFTHTILEKQKP